MSYEQYRPTGFSMLPVVVKNLLIINALFFLATVGLEKANIVDLNDILGFHYFMSPLFKPYQIVTYMFMHGDFWHILFNMFALWMFGYVLENVWGPKKFLIFYMVCGIGAVLFQTVITYFEISSVASHMSLQDISQVKSEGFLLLQESKNYVEPFAAKLNMLYNTPMIGASGAVFGILLAFGMLFPNTLLYIYGAIPIKAKWAVIIFGGMELVFGVYNAQGDNAVSYTHLTLPTN
jgi:membrane associated rhomboid family serine protease